jgi:hypothetical protein
MYKILQSTDWSLLIGGEVIQVAIGWNDVQVALFKDKGFRDAKISIWCDFEHKRAGQMLSNAAEMHVKATTLVSLLGKTVESVAASGEDALVLQFGNDETLTIIVDDAPYECFSVNGPDGLIVV